MYILIADSFVMYFVMYFGDYDRLRSLVGILYFSCGSIVMITLTAPHIPSDVTLYIGATYTASAYGCIRCVLSVARLQLL